MESAPLPAGRPTAALSSDDVAQLSGRIAELARCGLPLADGLRAAAGELRRGRAAQALRELATEIERGQPLDSALTVLGDRFPPHLRGLTLAGLSSGRLAEVLEQFVEQHRHTAALRRRARWAMAYPVLLVVSVAGLLLFYGATVAVDYADLGDAWGAGISVHTQALLLLGKYGPPAAAASLSLLVGLFLASRLLLGRAVIDSVLSWTPLVGSLWRWSSMAEFCRLLALMVEHQMPLPQALSLIAEASRDVRLASGCRQVAARVAEGRPLSDAVSQTPRFPPLLATMVAWHEGAAELAQSLRTAAAFFDERAQHQLNVVQRVAPAFAFVTVLLGVGFLVSAVMAPLIAAIESLS